MFEDDNQINNEQIEDSLDAQFGLTQEEPKKDDIKQQLQQQVEKKQHKPLSKEEYVAKHGSEEGYKSPEQWEQYGKAYEEVKELISGLKQAVTDRDTKIDSLIEYNARIEERVRERTLREIDADLRKAKENMDVEAVEKLTEIKHQTQLAAQHQGLQAREQERRLALSKFQERNKHWYGSNQAMMAKLQEFDTEIKTELNNNGLTLPMDKIARMLELKMQAEFPEVMLNPNAGANAPVINASQSGINRGSQQSESSSADFNQLSDYHKNIYGAYLANAKRKLASGKQTTKPMTQHQFIQKLKREGEI